MRCTRRLAVDVAGRRRLRSPASRRRGAAALRRGAGLGARARQSAGGGRRQERRLPLLPHRHRADCTRRRTCALGCTDCHGGDAAAPQARQPGPREYERREARGARAARATRTCGRRVGQPRAQLHGAARARTSPSSASSTRATCAWRRRPAARCHARARCARVRKSMMTHGGMLWGAALYNNGIVPVKNPIFGESYGPDGEPAACCSTRARADAEETRDKGVLPFLVPLPALGGRPAGQPVPRLRARRPARGSRSACPTRSRSRAGRTRASRRAASAPLNRTDPVVLGLQKTRLIDPLLSFLGTNDHPGDYRSSGCTACHVVYANDREPVHSGPYARGRQPRHSRSTRRPDDPEGRARPSDPARLHARDPVEPVHRLPHAPGHEHASTPTSATRGGTTRPTASCCTRRRSGSSRATERDAIERATPRARRCAACGRDREVPRRASRR